MKKTAKTLATILMLSAMVGLIGCTISIGEDETTPTVPVQPTKPDTPSTPEEQEIPGKPDGQDGTEKPGETTKPEEEGKTPVGPDTEEQQETENPGDNTKPDTPSTPEDQKEPGKPDEQDGTEKPGETTKPEEEGKTPVGPNTEEQQETENPGDNTKPEGEGETGGSSEQGGTEGSDQQEITPILPTKIGTESINSKEYNIVTFGQWPQSLETDTSKIDEENLTTYLGWDCYQGIDKDSYYVKRDATVIGHYDGPIENGKSYYFKIEPIKWRVVTDNYSGKKLLFAANALDARPYDADSNQYDTSDIRNFLNGEFFNKAFSEGEKLAIETTLVDNSENSAVGRVQDETIVNESLSDNKEYTEDKVFLLSLSEITKEPYGFNIYNEGRETEEDKKINASRKIPASDYTIAGNTWVVDKHCCYWLRSPVINGDQINVQMIGEDGCNGSDESTKNFGIVPALTVSQLSN